MARYPKIGDLPLFKPKKKTPFSLSHETMVRQYIQGIRGSLRRSK